MLKKHTQMSNNAGNVAAAIISFIISILIIAAVIWLIIWLVRRRPYYGYPGYAPYAGPYYPGPGVGVEIGRGPRYEGYDRR
jgi:hypothetical protein